MSGILGRSERVRGAWLTATLVTMALTVAGALAGEASAASSTLRGTVMSGDRPLASTPVKVYRSGVSDTTQLGRGVTDRRGRFELRYRRPQSAEAVIYLIAGEGAGIRLAATLGAPAVAPSRVVVNELTTTATGYAFAQFIGGRRITGPSPGPRNAALMARNLVNPQTGELGGVIRNQHNGNSTSTLQTFNSVANMLPRCARSATRCKRLFQNALTHNGRRPKGTLQAVANIAGNPWQNVNRLFKLSSTDPAPYGPALDADEKPAAWTMPLRFVGDGESVDGPGNFAFDSEGNAYVANNYEYGADPLVPRCGSDLLPVFGPDGKYPENSPFEGGGLSGAGYGVTMDPDGNVWVGNYGFAAPTPQCPAARQPPHDSVSKFAPDGTALSPDEGFTGGDMFWPQGTVSDQEGNIWVASCGNGNVTRIPAGDPNGGVAIDAGLERAFDVAINDRGNAFVTDLIGDKLAIIEPDGTPREDSPIRDLGLDRPMGIAADSRGNMWISNSAFLDLPCPGPIDIELEGNGGSLSMLKKGGKPATGPGTTFKGGGLTIAWGMAIDGDDNVWVSNFAEQRISQFCGVKTWKCPPGSETGDPISPDGTGYFFDGLVRVTAVEVDPSGNVWATNNWKLIPVQTNPGGYEVVVFVGAAEPVKTPLIGTPQALR